MWIKTDDGRLVNLARATAVWITPTPRAWLLFAEAGKRDFPLCGARTKREAQLLLDSILDAIDAGKKVWVAPGSGETVEKE